ncbi:hypothetical protein NVV95_15800 [Herbiconiux sp. CPCC 205716]|uniref:Uncharacterized protein n=1 Tax=Herbiconiux gentiana TaxID=2970912 RepID=A0ABT2GIF6_9MICO|nr:hypothetical protein [Herbiconiux gentiana]MCS5716008.1 hypothetical protein [Herbiconiux gentiana]
MAASLTDAQNAVLALNSDELPFVYTAEPDGVRATWKYADIKWASFTAAGLIDRSYELRVALDPAEGTWTFHETDTSSSVTARARPGGIGISGGTSTFSGRQKSVSFQFGATPVAAESTDRQGTHVGNTYGYAFTTDEVKAPLVAALTAAGYEPEKKGFFGKLFGG